MTEVGSLSAGTRSRPVAKRGLDAVDQLGRFVGLAEHVHRFGLGAFQRHLIVVAGRHQNGRGGAEPDPADVNRAPNLQCFSRLVGLVRGPSQGRRDGH